MFFFSSRRRHTRYWRDWSSDVCSSDLHPLDGRGVFGDEFDRHRVADVAAVGAGQVLGEGLDLHFDRRRIEREVDRDAGRDLLHQPPAERVVFEIGLKHRDRILPPPVPLPSISCDLRLQDYPLAKHDGLDEIAGTHPFRLGPYEGQRVGLGKGAYEPRALRPDGPGEPASLRLLEAHPHRVHPPEVVLDVLLEVHLYAWPSPVLAAHHLREGGPDKELEADH